MQQVSTTEEIQNASQKAITALYGDVDDFRINETFAIPEKGIVSFGVIFNCTHNMPYYFYLINYMYSY